MFLRLLSSNGSPRKVQIKRQLRETMPKTISSFIITEKSHAPWVRTQKAASEPHNTFVEGPSLPSCKEKGEAEGKSWLTKLKALGRIHFFPSLKN